MRFTTILSVIGLMATAAFAAPAEEGLLDRSLEARAPCPNPQSQIACEQACDSVVRNACKSCGGNPSCLTACQQARYKSCYSCCDKSCHTC